MEAIFLGEWNSIPWNSLESNAQWLTTPERKKTTSSQAPHKNIFVLGVVNQSCPNLFFEVLWSWTLNFWCFLFGGADGISHPSIIQEPRHNGPIVEDFGDHQVLSPGSFFVDCHGIVGSAMCWKIKLYYIYSNLGPCSKHSVPWRLERFWGEYSPHYEPGLRRTPQSAIKQKTTTDCKQLMKNCNDMKMGCKNPHISHIVQYTKSG